MTAMTYPEPDGSATTGHSGTDTSRDRAVGERDSGVAASRQGETLRLLNEMGYRGMTVLDLRTETGWHHGQASAALTNLHRAGKIARLATTRDHCKVYVALGYEGGKPTEQPGRQGKPQPIPLDRDEAYALRLIKSDVEAKTAVPRWWALKVIIEALEKRS